ncbi:hypothetical protein G7B40_015425 [Aetokthonos hydrillicola Thurmond2011]|jgi:Zn finger protein HypA/HybF involved in hydrogenase expression|uniref:Uncharacterized protein n=1 Tax=Aetokthonos hydrillicola Thurmond2011 TaxID=2712845 RepID=A0AAP5I6I8_9CYAN|nr:hypothetical protein [Aetokthonos hydrillicola]MDR9895943.1 hypothetical protein [Aetokthonos hydrillicola Thurmond2011]
MKKILPNPKPKDQNSNFEKHYEESELPPEQCQHVRIVDCDKPIKRVFYECYHCLQGLISECSGKPIIEEVKGRPSVREIKVRCPNCEQTAIKLSTGKVLSTTAIPSPWRQ